MRVQCAFIVKLQCLWIKILFTHLQLSIGVAHTSIHNVLRFSICIRKIVQLFFWFRRFLERHKPQFQAAQRCIKKWNGCKAWTKCSTRNPITKRTFVLHYTVTHAWFNGVIKTCNGVNPHFNFFSVSLRTM